MEQSSSTQIQTQPQTNQQANLEESNPNQLKIDNFTFQLSMYKNQDERQIVIERMRKLIDNFSYYQQSLLQKKFTQEQLTFFCQHLSIYGQTQFRICIQTRYAMIYKQIPKIYFTDTKVINFSNCNIANIQLFAYLQAPHLLTLELYNNHIMTLKPLVKNCSIRKMVNLTLYRNCITDFTSLQRFQTDISGNFQLDIKQYDKVVCEDLTLFYKMQFIKQDQNIRYWRSSADRINGLMEKIQKRFQEKA